jgi:hypothetical protein
MEHLTLIEIEKEELKNLPLFFRKIYFNQVSNIEDELKLYKYNSRVESTSMRTYFSNRLISKTVNYKTLEDVIEPK